MMNEEQIQGSWNEVKGKVQEKWGNVTDDDLSKAEGNFTELVGTIQRKTGEAREQIEKFLHDASSNVSSTLGSAAETAKEYANYAAENVSEVSQAAVDQVKAGYIQTERIVRRHPVESMAVCFGVGVITGVVTSLLISRR